MSNLKTIDYIYTSQVTSLDSLTLISDRSTTPSNIFSSSSTLNTNNLPTFIRSLSVNFQTENPKSCSEWVAYYSSVSEIWSFFLFFYFIALFFFFYYTVPKAIPSYRVTTNFATPVSWLSSFLSCGVPFFLIFTILYESVYLLFTSENFPARVLPLFLIEGRQWKWDYRFNLMSLIEYVGLRQRSSTGGSFKSGLLTGTDCTAIAKKLTTILGSDLSDNSLRVRTELLKGSRGSGTLRDSLASRGSYRTADAINRAPLAANVLSSFFFFKAEETVKRVVTANKSVFLPDLPVVKAYITGCDVIHS